VYLEPRACNWTHTEIIATLPRGVTSALCGAVRKAEAISAAASGGGGAIVSVARTRDVIVIQRSRNRKCLSRRCCMRMRAAAESARANVRCVHLSPDSNVTSFAVFPSIWASLRPSLRENSECARVTYVCVDTHVLPCDWLIWAHSMGP